MGKGKRIKAQKTRTGQMVRIDKVAEEMEIAVNKAIALGEERGFMKCMEYVQEKLETLHVIQGVGKSLNERITQHFMTVPTKEPEEVETVTQFTSYTRDDKGGIQIDKGIIDNTETA